MSVTGIGGAGGAGGGGKGQGRFDSGVAGTANTGGGGGAGVSQNLPVGQAAGYAGGSGLVVIAIPTANYSGTTTGLPTVTTLGPNTILTFTGSGSYTA
jgi:hypothetical protein